VTHGQGINHVFYTALKKCKLKAFEYPALLPNSATVAFTTGPR
jgi:hypothetical protein